VRPRRLACAMLASTYARRACAAEKREDDASPVPGGGPGPDGGEARAGLADLGAGGEARAGLADLGAGGEARAGVADRFNPAVLPLGVPDDVRHPALDQSHPMPADFSAVAGGGPCGPSGAGGGPSGAGAAGATGGGAGAAGGGAGRTGSRLADLYTQAHRIGWRAAEGDLYEERRVQGLLGPPRMELASKPGRDLPRPVSPKVLVRYDIPSSLRNARSWEEEMREAFWDAYEDWEAARESLDAMELKVYNERLAELDAVQARIGDSAEEYLRRHNALDKPDFDSETAKSLRLAAKAERNETLRLRLCAELVRLQEAARSTPSASAPPADGEGAAGGEGGAGGAGSA
jgi:hypothetical protein